MLFLSCHFSFYEIIHILFCGRYGFYRFSPFLFFVFLFYYNQTIYIFENYIVGNTFHMRKQISMFLNIVFESFSRQVLNNAFLSNTTLNRIFIQSVVPHPTFIIRSIFHSFSSWLKAKQVGGMRATKNGERKSINRIYKLKTEEYEINYSTYCAFLLFFIIGSNTHSNWSLF